MVINSDEYCLSEDHYIKVPKTKTKIIIGDTTNVGDEHYNEWVKKIKYLRTAHYTILKTGEILEHFDSNYWCRIFDDENDCEIIKIVLENQGQLKYLPKKDTYINCYGNIYKGEGDDIIAKKWRGCILWDSYTKEQVTSLSDLCINLSQKHKIPLEVLIKNEDKLRVPPRNYKGIIPVNLYSELSTEVNITFNWEELKKNIKYE